MLICSIQVSAISGEGTEESPYLITNEAELFLVKDFPDSHFALMNDVYVSDTSKDLGTFTGVFDGNNHTIDVGFITNKGKIRNVNFENSSVLSDYNYGEIENCRVIVTNNEKSYDNIVCYQNSGTIRAVDVNVKNGNLEYSSGGGGVARYNYGTIEKCSFVSENTYFESTYPYAGIAYQNNGVITKCCSKLYSANFERVITQYKTYTASFYGISYDNSYGTIEDCYVRLACINSVYSGLSASYKNCYYVINNTSGSVNGVSKSLLAITMKATYAGWDFDRIWAINPEVNDGYPYFQWEDIRKQVSYPYANIEIGAVKSGTKIIKLNYLIL